MSAPIEFGIRNMPRWRATILYRTETGPELDVTHEFEELYELHDLVEFGPDWNSIIKIEVTLARPLNPNLTVEQAARQ